MLALVLQACTHSDASPAPAAEASSAAPTSETRPETPKPETELVPSAELEPGAEPDPELEAAPSRTVLATHVENARDLGGVALQEGAKVAPGLLFRGPPLAQLSEEGCAAVSALGLRSVIDLRVSSEVSLLQDDPCVLSEAQLVAAPLPVPYNVSAADYIAVLDSDESMLRVFETLGEEARYPVYFHCTWGRDRTGILAAVVLLALGASPEAVMADYLVSDETVGAYPASLQATLDEIAARGGIDAYLAALGVPSQQLATLRAHAIDKR